MKVLYLLSSFVEKSALFVFVLSTILNLSELLIVITMTLTIVFYISKYIFFAKYTNQYPLKPNNYPKRYILPKNTENDVVWIDFVLSGGIWTSYSNNNEISINLNGYIFQKQFISAYVSRQFRYPLVNKMKSLLILFRRKVQIPQFEKNTVYVRFNIDGKITDRKIIDKGKNTITWLQRAIIKSRYYTTFLYMQSAVESKNRKGKIDEAKYNNGVY